MDEVIDSMTFYSYPRIHSTLGYGSAMQFEKSWPAAQLLEAACLTSNKHVEQGQIQSKHLNDIIW